MDRATITFNVYVQTDTPGLISKLAAEMELNHEWTSHFQDLIIQAVSAALAGKFDVGEMIVGTQVPKTATNIDADRGETIH
jgi:hypothetical protein